MKYLFFLIYVVITHQVYAESLSPFASKCEDIYVPISELTECAKQGDAFSQYNLGVMYRDGINVAKDPNQAFYWLEKAAEQGMPEAETNLGELYQLGIGVNKNPELAFQWTYKAVKQGEIMAVNNLGNYLYEGFGTERDIRKAILLYELAAENGVSASAINLSMIYFYGDGVPQNKDRAILFAKQAAENGDVKGMAFLSLLYRELGAYSDAFYWSQKAANENDPTAQANLAYLFATGKGVEKNKEQSEFWLSKAEKQNDRWLNVVLGGLYEEENSILGKDLTKALAYYLKAANMNDGSAKNNIGRILFADKSKEENDLIALDWFLKAANENNVTVAMYTLYQIYSSGSANIAKDAEKAEYWLKRAKENGFNPN